ncbi:MAG: RNA-binding protein [candidate division Zixibacteria bacterium]|nr:RNA-binding protein [candidate division Zixibacteria bacterium]
MNIHVGNLAPETVDADLRKAFEAFGTVTRTHIIMDRATSQSRGFGFVEMATQAEGEAAIAGLSGKELMGRKLAVSVARGKTEGGVPRA